MVINQLDTKNNQTAITGNPLNLRVNNGENHQKRMP